MKHVKSFQNDLPIFYAIYNISAMKMHQLHRRISGTLIGVFTYTILVEGTINKVECNKSIIGGIRETDVKEFTQLTSTDPRTTKYMHEIIKLNKIDECDITGGYGYWYVLLTGTTNNKGCFITGEAGTGKTTTANKLKHNYNQSNIKYVHQHINLAYYMMMHKEYIHYLILINIIIHI